MRTDQLRRSIPWWMAASRAGLGPLMAAGQAAGWSGAALALAVIVALVSDIFDGVLARRWRCDTPAIRLFDSIADTVFYAGTGTALWLRHPELVRSLAWPVAVVAGLELARLAIEVTKFGKPASYHSRLAKLWGLCLANAAILGFLPGRQATVGLSWLIALVVGIACDAEGLAMSLALPVWRNDVLDFQTALQFRAQAWKEGGIPQPTTPTVAAVGSRTSGKRSVAWTRTGLMAIALFAATCARAEPIGPATWVGGTAPGLAAGATGRIEFAAPERLVFRPDAGPELAIPYSAVQTFSYRCVVRHHLGVLPAIAVGLIAARQHRHTVTLGYTDPVAGTKQAAIFDLTRDGAQVLLAVLRERTSVCAPSARQTCGGRVG